jgi:glucose/arabinose dehydrogenase
MRSRVTHRSLCAAAIVATAVGCTDAPTGIQDAPEPDARRGHRSSRNRVQCAPDNGGITLPPGFCAVVVADLVMAGRPAAARHLAVTPTGDVFVAINPSRSAQPAFGIIGLRDTDGDGDADEQVQFSPGLGGSGLAWSRGHLWFGANDQVQRFPLPAGRLMPTGGPAVVVAGLPNTGDHVSKTVVVGRGDALFVNIGSASNACQVENRVAQSPGVFPCPELPVRAGVWRFAAFATGQTQADGQHWATGLRNMVALALNPRDGQLYGVQHGRDMLFENWPQFYTQADDAVLPSEEFVRIRRGSDNGWPYCYHDPFQGKKVLAPEYGGDGELTAGTQGIDCSTYNRPLVTFGAHWAPNGLHFYTGKQFPQRYRHGAFVAFHGGFDRAPLPNEGYQVAFVPFDKRGRARGTWETFADNFAGSDGPLPANAKHRPVGVAEGPDGSLYVSDDRGGRIYRIVYTGR